MSMESFSCQGTTVITGLEIIKKEPDDSEPARCGVFAKFSRFARGLVVASRAAGQTDEIAVIPGLLDLTGSEIRELSVSNESFPDMTVKNSESFNIFKWIYNIYKSFTKQYSEDCITGSVEQKFGIVLNQATVNKLTSVINGSEYPQPIDLRYAEIKWWDFQNEDRSHSGTAYDFIKLLKGDPHLQRHTFRSIEKNLIDHGHDEDADLIHKEMRKWIRNNRPHTNSKSLLLKKIRLIPYSIRTFFLWIWDTATGSTTTPYRLLAIVLLWFCLSTLYFSFPENIVPTSQALIAYHDELKPDQHPAPGEWKGMAGFWIAVRYHIPVATFTAQDDWQPTGRDKLLFWKNGSGEGSMKRVSAITAEDYANIVTGLHWILWPVILIIASRKFFRYFEK